MENILVTGGAGFVGAHTCKELKKNGYHPLVVDNLSTGHRSFVKWGELREFSLANEDALRQLFRQKKIQACLHFAAHAYVGESNVAPEKYYSNNVLGTLNLLNAMKEARSTKIVFSSSCAVYGIPGTIPIPETHPLNPVNSYGRTKWVCESMLKDFETAYGIKSVSLRYFNASGADPEGEIGESHDPEPHLIPLAIASTRENGPALSIFGSDYPTNDGTCVRDYVHVTDLANAHVEALKYLLNGGNSNTFNLGTGEGHSVKEIVTTVEKALKKKCKTVLSARRPGDPPTLIADPSKASRVLHWKAKYNVADQIQHAAKWLGK